VSGRAESVKGNVILGGGCLESFLYCILIHLAQVIINFNRCQHPKRDPKEIQKNVVTRVLALWKKMLSQQCRSNVLGPKKKNDVTS
jgi:hypothetical protein